MNTRRRLALVLLAGAAMLPFTPRPISVVPDIHVSMPGHGHRETRFDLNANPSTVDKCLAWDDCKRWALGQTKTVTTYGDAQTQNEGVVVFGADPSGQDDYGFELRGLPGPWAVRGHQ